MCDETPNDQSGVWMCQKLEEAAGNFLHGGIQVPHLPSLVVDEVEVVIGPQDKIAPPPDAPDKEWEKKKREAHKKLETMNEAEMETANLEY